MSDDNFFYDGRTLLFPVNQENSIGFNEIGLQFPPFSKENHYKDVLLQESLISIVGASIENAMSHSELTGLFKKAHYYASLFLYGLNIEEGILTRQYIHRYGLVMSPLHCVSTLLDISRNACFYKGLHQLIKDLLARGEPIKLVYPGCGLFAPLVLPVILFMFSKRDISSKDISLTLIDLQPGVIKVLREFIKALGLNDFKIDLIEADATDYQGRVKFDILVVESFQKGLTKEAHINIVHNFLPQLSEHGVMLPSKVKIYISGHTAEVGELLWTIDRTSMHNVTRKEHDGIEYILLPVASFQNLSQLSYSSCLYIELMTYNDHWLKRGESGITSNHVLSAVERIDVPEIDGLLCYQLTGLPGFKWVLNQCN